jgi:hypothetical protein
MPMTRTTDLHDAAHRPGVGRCNPVPVARIADEHIAPQRKNTLMSITTIEGSLRCEQ